MRYHGIVLMVFCLSIIRHPVLAQIEIGFSLPAFALLDIEPGYQTLSLSFNAPTKAGAPLATGRKSQDQNMWLNYTSAVAQGGTKRQIYAHVSNGSLPEGISLELLAKGHQGIGKGALGRSFGKISLQERPQAILRDIGGAFTGDGVGNGHQLIYELKIDDFDQLKAASSVHIEIMFTITE